MTAPSSKYGRQYSVQKHALQIAQAGSSKKDFLARPSQVCHMCEYLARCQIKFYKPSSLNPEFKTQNPEPYTLPKGPNVVPFWVCYGFWVRDYNILPKKELHRRVWLNPMIQLPQLSDLMVEGEALALSAAKHPRLRLRALPPSCD